MLQMYQSIKSFKGDDFKKEIKSNLERVPEEQKLQFLNLAMIQNIEEAQEGIFQNQVIRTMKEDLRKTIH